MYGNVCGQVAASDVVGMRLCVFQLCGCKCVRVVGRSVCS